MVVGSGVAVTAVPGGGRGPSESLTERLTVYPEAFIAQPLSDGSLEVEVAADDAVPVVGAAIAG